MKHIFKIVYYFLLMLKEVILGKASLWEAYKYDPRRVYILVIVIMSLFINLVSVTALIRSIEEGKVLREEISKLEKINEDLVLNGSQK